MNRIRLTKAGVFVAFLNGGKEIEIGAQFFATHTGRKCLTESPERVNDYYFELDFPNELGIPPTIALGVCSDTVGSYLWTVLDQKEQDFQAVKLTGHNRIAYTIGVDDWQTS